MCLFNVIKGIIYGIFSVIPGLSGGVLASYFGDYEKCISIISSVRLILKNFVYIFSLFVGLFIGVIFSSKLILSFYYGHVRIFNLFVIVINVIILFLYIYKCKMRLSVLLCIFILAATLCLFVMHYINISLSINIYVTYIISSIIYSVSKIFPGISSTILLINIGFYDDFMLFLSSPFNMFISMPFLWIIFWFVFIMFSIILIRFIGRLVNKNYFDALVVFIMIINLLMVFI